MGLGDDRLLSPATVSGTLRCPICHDVFMNPVFSSGKPCQHVFCRDCIGEALDRRASCPVCRAAMRKTNLQPHHVMRSLLDELQVRCEVGCSWTGRQDAHSAHLEVCPARLLAAMRAKLDETSAEFTAQVGRQRDCIARLQRTIEEQGSSYRQALQQMSQLRDDAARKNVRIIELETELDIARSCADANAAASVAESRADAANQAFQEAKMALVKANKEAAVARQRAADAKNVQIFVRDLCGKTQVIRVHPQDTIETVKVTVQTRTGCPVGNFYLTHGSKVLKECDRLLSYGITNDSSLYMTCRLPSARIPVERLDTQEAKRRKVLAALGIASQ